MKDLEVNFKIIREDKRLSQQDIAEKMGITQSAYARIEASKTKMKVETLELFSQAVGMSITDVIMYPEKWARIDLVKENGDPVQKSERQEAINRIISEHAQLSERCKVLERMIEQYKEEVSFLRGLIKK